MNNPVKCYICADITNKPLFVKTTNYTQTPICQIVKTFIGFKDDGTTRTGLVDESLVDAAESLLLDNAFCDSCTDKINEYDLAIVTARRIEQELKDIYLSTNEKFELDDDDTTQDHLGDTAASMVDPATYTVVSVFKTSDDEDETAAEHMIVDDHVSAIIEEDTVTSDEDYSPSVHRPSPPNHDDVSSPPKRRRGRPRKVAANEIIVKKEDDDDDDESSDDDFDDNVMVGKKRRGRPRKVVDANDVVRTKRPTKKPPSDSAAKIRQTQKSPTEKLVCDICGQTYKTRTALSIHVAMHQGRSPHECELCKKKFTQKGALVRHMPLHTGERPYQCDKCGKQFIHYSSFHMHQLAHDNIRQKKCTICGLELRSNSHLTRHLRVHSGEKPYACPTCGQKFAQRYNMMTHYKAHQGIHRVSSKTHICPICYSSFPKQSKLNEHLANQHQSYSAAITSPPATPIPVARLIHSAETLTVDSSPTTSSVTKTSSITPQRRHNFVPISHSRLLEPSDVEEIKQETFVDNS